MPFDRVSAPRPTLFSSRKWASVLALQTRSERGEHLVRGGRPLCCISLFIAETQMSDTNSPTRDHCDQFVTQVTASNERQNPCAETHALFLSKPQRFLLEQFSLSTTNDFELQRNVTRNTNLFTKRSNTTNMRDKNRAVRVRIHNFLSLFLCTPKRRCVCGRGADFLHNIADETSSNRFPVPTAFHKQSGNFQHLDVQIIC